MVIAVVSALLLGVSNSYTAPIIEENRLRTLESKMFSYFPEVDEFLIETVDDEEFFVVKDDDNIQGVATVVKSSGYGGRIELMLAVNNHGYIEGVEILSHSETPGLGSEITEPEWLAQFNGLTAFDEIEISEDIDVIAGATRSCEGVAEGTKIALDNISQAYYDTDDNTFND